MEGDREGGINLSQALIAEDVHFHLVVVDWREREEMEPTVLKETLLSTVLCEAKTRPFF